MKRGLALFFILITVAVIWQWKKTDTLAVSAKPQAPSLTAVFPPAPVPSRPKPERTPAQAAEQISLVPFDATSEQKIAIGGDDVLLPEIFAIARKKYRQEIGKKVSEDRFFIYFRSAVVSGGSSPVAYDRSLQKLYPVSHILHLKGIDPAERDLLRAEGMAEYYYHPRLKYLSLKSTPTRVLRDYQHLKERGFDVRMEVLKERVKPN
jgi:hypothetical protein